MRSCMYDSGDGYPPLLLSCRLSSARQVIVGVNKYAQHDEMQHAAHEVGLAGWV